MTVPKKGAQKGPKKRATRPTHLRLVDPAGTDDGTAVDRFIQEFDCSDTGNAERLAAKFGHCIRYVPQWDEHLVYKDGHWKRDTGGVDVGRFAKQTVAAISDEAKNSGEPSNIIKWRKKSAAQDKRRAMVNLLKHEDDIAVDHTELDQDRWALNVKNGTLDLKTCQLRQHDAKDLITKHIRLDYNKKAKATRWLQFLKEVLPDPEVREFVHRYMGYCLTGDVGERIFVIFLGAGKNGKSAFLNAVESVMEEYATTAAPTLLVARELDAHSTDVADLFGARLAVSSETKNGATFDEERVKRLTGTDRLKARRMREDFWHFDPTHKLLIASNHKPRVKDATDSFWDRLALVPFNVRIKPGKVDRKLGSKLREERAGILAWLVEGCRLWQKGGLKAPPAVREATAEYREEEDIVGRFLDECCDFKKTTAYTSTKDLMAVSGAWASDMKLRSPLTDKELAKALRAKKCENKKRHGNKGWVGLTLTKQPKFK